MSTFDSPDYQNVVTLSSGPVSDAPDWQEVIVGPGGAPIGGGGGDLAPPDFDLVGWTCNPFATSLSAGVSTFSNGHVWAALIKAVTSATVTHVAVSLLGAFVNYTANENFLGIYSTTVSGGAPGLSTQVAVTAAGGLDAAFVGDGVTFVPLVSSVAVTAGTLYYMAMLLNGVATNTTITSQSIMGTLYQRTIMPSGHIFLYGDISTSRTVLPGSFTPTLAASAHNEYSPWFCMY